MEPVPESERMEAFRSSPLPTVRLQGPSPLAFASPTPLPPRYAAEADDNLRKPLSMRRSTEPISPTWSSPPALPYRPRTTSPLSGTHTRSRSLASPGSGLFPPAMGRTQSMPGVNGSGHLQYGGHPRSSSPHIHRPANINIRTPRKAVIEDVFPSSPTRVSVIQDHDHRLHERNSSPNLHSPTSIAAPPAVVSLPMVRTRRPLSPFRRVATAPTSSPVSGSFSVSTPTAASSTTSGANMAEGPSTPPPTSSPSYRPYDASFSSSLSVSSYGPGTLSSSSVPSTPTSTRSRSPSISSLETIPDSPDAEEAALEAERIAQLKAAADAVDGGDAKGRGSLDVPSRGRTLSYGARDKRKRWSVCGAERRGDLDLETIWED